MERVQGTPDKITNQKPGAFGVAILMFGAAFVGSAAQECNILPNMPVKPAVSSQGELKTPNYKIAP